MLESVVLIFLAIALKNGSARPGFRGAPRPCPSAGPWNCQAEFGLPAVSNQAGAFLARASRRPGMGRQGEPGRPVLLKSRVGWKEGRPRGGTPGGNSQVA